MPQTLTEIKTLLAAHGLRPQQRFGQNFLHDANQMARILAAAEVRPGDLVLEVGPGTGALSEWLLEAGARVVAVEIDRGLEPILRERLEPLGGERFRLVMADVLTGKHQINPAVIEALGKTNSATSRDREGAAFKLIANLPYNVASPLLVNLAMDYPQMALAVVMIQREVAARLAAGPDAGKEYGPLGVIVQAMCHVERIATLPPSCFWPQPQVESAVVRLRRRERPLTDNPHALARTLQTLFTKRRKQIGTILGRDRTLPAGIDPSSRPEQLSVEQIILLAQALAD